MEKYYKRKSPSHGEDVAPSQPSHRHNAATFNRRDVPEDINWEVEIQFDPGKRKRIEDYHPNQKEMVRRKYLDNGPCQPRPDDLPVTNIGGRDRKFNPEWYDEFGSWLEYSESKDKVYCFYCFLFRDPNKKSAGYDAFVTSGWSSWNKKHRLKEHVGDIDSVHNQAMRDCDALLKKEQHIDVSLNNQSNAEKIAYYTRLNGSIDVTRILLKLGMPFRGHDESEESLNKGNFKEFHAYTAEQNPALHKVAGKNAPGNSQYTSSKIQNDIIRCFAKEVLRYILEEVGNDVFCLLVDESRDVSYKEQMAVVLRYVGKCGSVKERLVGLVHVKETTSMYLKSAIDDLFAEHKLSLKQVRGQGYDGASNMRGEFNGLQSLIMRENSSAYYIHCFAHQLQLVVVAIVKKHKGIGNFFDMISLLLNVVGGSSKRRDMIRDINAEHVHDALECGLLITGSGLNQEISLQRPGDTRWSSHYKTLKSLVQLFPTTVKVLEYVEENDRDDKNSRQAAGLLVYFQLFQFVFYLQLMLNILAITNTFSVTLQRKDQDIVNAVNCVKSTRNHLDEFRRSGWESILAEVHNFCEKYDISELEMEDAYINPKRPRQKTGITNKHHFEVDCFNEIVDWLLQELDNRFNEKTSQLLICAAALSPRQSFHDFNLEHLMSLAKLYPKDFDDGELMDLRHHLSLYIADVRGDDRFANIETICQLSQKMVDTRKHICYPLVYRLLKLALVLPVATATVERCFSAMKIVKTYLRNRISDEHLSDCVICYVEKQELMKVTNSAVIHRFETLKARLHDVFTK
ncbi:uncharacterized protein [Oryza sativa Japonica Group]|uniref:uncharacterized protein n=1 Tax=Oryza sativa subsp. japonica TaxID=39947 RepID=UPI00000A3A4D|nr:zinc finger MYM-type protein 1-like [Oryza sativa Japonica Group]